MDASIQITRPPVSALSSPALSFLNSEQDLSRARSFIDEFQSQCFNLDQTLIGLNSRLHSTLLSYASFSDGIHLLFDDATSKLTDLRSFTCPPPLSSSLSPSDGQGRKEEILGEELPVLAKEVARVETVRAYAETALKLDTLVGDIEDVVSSTMNKKLRKHSSTQSVEEMRLLAIERLRQTEDVLISVTVTHPQWTSLVSAVDHRIDRALATLRPQAIADHRSLLGSLGWPPPLSTLMSAKLDAGKSTAEVSNPLFTMQGLLKQQYCENFLALCHLQELQWRRKSRQLEGSIRKLALQQPLWAIKELVNPISIACQRHFSKWIDNPSERRTKGGRDRNSRGSQKTTKSLQASNVHNSASGYTVDLNKMSGQKQGKGSAVVGEANSSEEIQALSKEITDMKLSVDLLEKERDFYFAKLRDIEILCQTPELEDLPMAVAIKKILYAADTKESALEEAQEFLSEAIYTAETEVDSEV